MQTGENSIIEARILYHSNTYTYIMLLSALKYKFMTLWLNTTINSFALTELLHLIKHLSNLQYTFPRSLNGESCHVSHLVYKFDKQISRRSNSQIKILNLFEFHHALAA